MSGKDVPDLFDGAPLLLLGRYSGQSLTYLHLSLDDGNEAIFLLGDDYKVTPSEAFVAELGALLTPDAVQLR